jgi:hypothetical protein
MTLQRRLNCLEAARRDEQHRQCQVCRSWPKTRVTFSDEPDAVIGAPVPQCPRCRWEPHNILVKYGDVVDPRLAQVRGTP